MLRQIGQHKQFHTVLLDLAVRGNVAAGDPGIDRYLSGVAASRCEREQVDGRLAALALNMLYSLWSQVDLHRLPLWPVTPAGVMEQR